MNNQYSIFSRRCFINNKLIPATIFVEDGKISNIKYVQYSGAANYGNNIIMPGVIDIHVHVNEPGRTDWEGFETATKAAAKGGVTTIVDMPLNSSPVTVSEESFNQKLEASKGKLNVNCGFYGGLVPGKLNYLIGLMDKGILGVKCFLIHSGIDEFPNVTEKDLEEAMPIIKLYGLPLLVHCELSKENSFTEPHSYKKYLQSRPDDWETSAIKLMVNLCRKYKCHVHIVHVSSAQSLPLIRAAKAEGLPLTAETCPHYIYFSAEEIPDGQPVFKCAPPIRSKNNNDALKQALVDGTLDLIASDHSPAPPSIKMISEKNLAKAWGGIAGLQFLLNASYSAMRDLLPIEKFIPLLTSHPAKILGIESKGVLSEGADADIVIWNDEENTFVTEETIMHKYSASPFNNCNFSGRILCSIVNGEVVYENGNFLNFNKGKWLMKK